MQGGPDAILFDPFNERVYIFSLVAPNATVINAADGSVVGTIDHGGMPEQAVTDGNGRVYVDIRDRGNVAVIDANTDALPIGAGVDAAIFNPKTKETFSSQVDGTLTVAKEKSPVSFVVEQTVQTKPSAKQLVWDSKTNRILLIAADYIPAPSPPRAGAPAGLGQSQNSYRNPMRTERDG